MKILLTIAWRNLREHRVKTWIVGILLMIGILVLVVGNSLMDTATRGIESAYTHNYTGHLMVTGRTQGSLTMFGYQDMTALEQAVPLVPAFDKLEAYLQDQPYVAAVNPQATGMAAVSVRESSPVPVQLFGIDPQAYQQTFPDNLELLRGRFLQPGEDGILLSEWVAGRIERRLGEPPQPGDELLLTGMTAHAGVRIRAVPIRGIFRFRQSNPQLDMVSLLDITNLRALNGMSIVRVDPDTLAEGEDRISGPLDEDALFGSELFITDVETDSGTDDEDWYGILGGEGYTVTAEDSSAWHFLLVRLTDERHMNQATADLKSFFAAEDIDAQVNSWLEAAGAIAEMSFGVRWLFNAIVIIIAVVAVIIITNTLVISVTERLTEIGTMRAIGAQKAFVRRMILWETLLLSGLFGSAGVLLSAAVLGILYLTGIPAPNMFFEIIFGGPVLYPTLSLQAVVMSLALVVAVAVIASLYPAAIVMKASPLTAMQSD